jgi:hypothetical protein
MKKQLLILSVLLAVLTSCASQQQKTGQTAEDGSKVVEYLYVQNAKGISFDSGVLTLRDVSPTTLFFSDRPERIVGHMLTKEFLEDWGVGEDNFAANPPNAALSIFNDKEIVDVVVVLSNPKIKDGNLIYEVRILDGEIPQTGGESSLFIDVIGRPLSPVSVAGRHRRVRRHAVLR